MLIICMQTCVLYYILLPKLHLAVYIIIQSRAQSLKAVIARSEYESHVSHLL